MKFATSKSFFLVLFLSPIIHASERTENVRGVDTRRELSERRQLKAGKSGPGGKSGGKSKIDSLQEYQEMVIELNAECSSLLAKCAYDTALINLEFQALAAQAVLALPPGTPVPWPPS